MLEEFFLEVNVYCVLVIGVCDYVNKNGFCLVVFGLFGGIDLVVIFVVVVDVLGKDWVWVVMMLFCYIFSMSLEDVEVEVVVLGV